MPDFINLKARERYFEYASHTRARVFSLLKTDESHIFTPIVQKEQFPMLAGKRNNMVLQVALKSFPVPAEDVSLEEIVDFKRTKKVQDQLQLFRRWVRKTVVEENATAAEIGEEIADMLHDFREHMRVAKLKVQRRARLHIIDVPARDDRTRL